MSCRTRGLAVVGMACLLMVFGGVLFAQQSTLTETKSFEVVSVDGNKVVLRGAEGSKEITVPADFRFNVGGKQMTVQELKPGMKGTATITTTTTTTPVAVTEVRNGEVIKVSGGSVVLRTDNGYRMFNQGDMTKRNVTILRDGKPVKLSDLNTGDHLSATIVTEGAPQVLTEREVQASIAEGHATSGSATASAPKTGSTAAKPATSTGDSGASTSAATTSTAGSATLPDTASSLPLLAWVGMALLAIASTLAWRRRRG